MKSGSLGSNIHRSTSSSCSCTKYLHQIWAPPHSFAAPNLRLWKDYCIFADKTRGESCFHVWKRRRWLQNCCCSWGFFRLLKHFFLVLTPILGQLMFPTWLLPELFLRSQPQAGRWSPAVRPTDLLESAAATMAVVENLVTRGNGQGTLGPVGYEMGLANVGNMQYQWGNGPML